MVEIDKSLHFIVRHPGYQQTSCYGIVLNEMLRATIEAQAARADDVRARIELIYGRMRRCSR